ncbi:MAG: hypothetical protein M0Q91_10120 [Methanoregula sp.]|nr:hypothetical protein [Methanoregula sp.]
MTPRSHQPVKGGLVDPDLSCPLCKLGDVVHIGHSWMLKAPKQHYYCLNCLHLFQIPLPKKPLTYQVWRSA